MSAERTVSTTVTFLAMDARAGVKSPLRPLLKTAIMRAEEPTTHFYRYLYNVIGEPYLWMARRSWSDDELQTLMRDPKIALYVLYVGGVPGSMAELDFRKDTVCQVAFFGLMPEFTGRRIGPWFLHPALELAWAEPVTRVLVETCTLDHKKALATYQRAGFSPYARSERQITVPAGVRLPEGMISAEDRP